MSFSLEFRDHPRMIIRGLEWFTQARILVWEPPREEKKKVTFSPTLCSVKLVERLSVSDIRGDSCATARGEEGPGYGDTDFAMAACVRRGQLRSVFEAGPLPEPDLYVGEDQW